MLASDQKAFFEESGYLVIEGELALAITAQDKITATWAAIKMGLHETRPMLKRERKLR